MPLASPLLAFAIVRLCFAQFYFENRQSVFGSLVPLRQAPTRMLRSWLLTPSTRCATDVPTPRWCGRSSPCPMPSACSSGGGGVTLQTVCRVKAVDSSCNLGKADSAPLPAPRSRTRTPPAPPAEIRFIGHTAWRKRCDRHSPRGVFFDGTVLFPAELPAIDCRPTAASQHRPRRSTHGAAAQPLTSGAKILAHSPSLNQTRSELNSDYSDRLLGSTPEEQQHDPTHPRGIFHQADRLESLRDHGQHDAAPRS